MARTENGSNFHVINLIIRRDNYNEDLTTEEYATIFRNFYLANVTGKSSREKECILITNAQYEINNIPNSVQYGRFVEYTNIDKRGWFDIIKKELDESFRIPDNLRANSIQGTYFFLAEKHRFCYTFTSKENIHPKNAESYLRNAFEKFLTAEYNDEYYLEINFEKERETIQEILDAKEIYSLTVDVSYSNSGIGFGSEALAFVDGDMRKGNIDSLHIEAKNKNGETIDLGKSTVLRGALESSASNGNATAVIKDGRKKKTIKTSDHPAKYKTTFEGRYEFINQVYSFFINLF